jgi:curli biogenesis system outer membrane secretion channel CsgG
LALLGANGTLTPTDGRGQIYGIQLEIGENMQKVIAVRGVALFAAFLLVGCATESHRAVETPQVKSARAVYQGPRVVVTVGKFDNRSNFMRGIFTDGVDRLGSQAKTILISHLQESQRFNVLERENLEEARQEAGFGKQQLATKAADFIITGAVAEFGRKEVGDQQLFGILGRGKTQVAYAKITLNVVNVRTSEVVYTSSGAGEYELSSREVIGFGGTSSYDSTLNGKVLDLAMREAIDKLVSGVDGGVIRPGNR